MLTGYDLESRFLEIIQGWSDDWMRGWYTGEMHFVRQDGKNTIMLFRDRLELEGPSIRYVLYFSSLPSVGHELLKIFHRLNAKDAEAILGILSHV